MKTKEKQARFKPEILKLLKKNSDGMVVAKINNELNSTLSRNTIMTYLEQMKEEGKVSDWKIGRYRLWFHRDHYRDGGKSPNPQNVAVFKFLEEFFATISADPKLKRENWVDFGVRMGKRMKFYPFFPRSLQKKGELLMTEKDIQMQNIFDSIYAPILQNVLFWLGDSTAVVEPPITHLAEQIPLFSIVRIRNTKFSTNNVFYQVLCGLELIEVNAYLGKVSKVEIHAMHPAEKIVDLKFSFA